MTLPASGQISIQDLVDEFGGTAPHGLTEYYRGGAFVPDISANSGVPISGQIGLHDFYSAAAVAVLLNNHSLSDLTGLVTQVSIEFTPIGELILETFAGGSSVTDPDEWALPRGSGSSPGDGFDIRLTVSSGDAPSSGPAVNTWHSLATAREWGLGASNGASASGTWLVEIRDGTTLTVLDSATFTMTVDSQPL